MKMPYAEFMAYSYAISRQEIEQQKIMINAFKIAQYEASDIEKHFEKLDEILQG